MLLLSVFVVGCSGAAKDNKETVEEAKSTIRDLIPEAAGSPTAEFDELSRPDQAPALAQVKQQSFTVAVLLLRFTKETADEKHREEFRLIGDDLPKPSKLANAFAKSKELGYYTAIHPDYITEFTCEVSGSLARGSVSFEAKGVYAGKVNFVASKTDGKWRIVEFQLPTWDVTTTRKNGDWKFSGTGAVMPSG
jgi:hypothetical protein